MSKFILEITNSIGIQQSDFKTLQDCQDHLVKGQTQGWWGKEEYTYTVPEQTIIHPAEVAEPAIEGKPATQTEPEVIAKDAVIKPQWEEIIPAHDITVPRSYSWVIIDKSAESMAEETKKTDRISRIEQFKLIDWSSIDTLAEIKVIVRALVKEAIRNDE